MAPHRLKLLGACLVSFLLAGMGHLESPSWPASCTSVAFSLVHLGPWLGLCSLAVSAASAPSSASSSSPSARRFTASSLPRVSSGSAAVCQPSRGFPPWPPADASASWPLDTPCGEHSRRTCCSLGQARRIGVKVAEAFPEQYMASAPPQQPFSSSRSAASVQASAQPPLRVGEAVVHDTVPSSPSSPSSASALRLSSAGHRCMEATAHVWCADCDGGVGVGGFSGGSSRDRVVLSYSFCNWWWAACRSAYWSTSSRGSVTAITPCTPKALACARARDIVANAREFCLVGGYDVAEPTPVERQAAALNRDKQKAAKQLKQNTKAVKLGKHQLAAPRPSGCTTDEDDDFLDAEDHERDNDEEDDDDDVSDDDNSGGSRDAGALDESEEAMIESKWSGSVAVVSAYPSLLLSSAAGSPPASAFASMDLSVFREGGPLGRSYTGIPSAVLYGAGVSDWGQRGARSGFSESCSASAAGGVARRFFLQAFFGDGFLQASRGVTAWLRACGPVWIRTARAVRRSITNDSQISRLLIICVGLVIMFIVLFNRKRSAYTKMNEAQRPASDADLRARAAELRAHYHMLYNQQRPPVLKHPNTRETFDSVPYTPEAFAEHCPDC
eukprot:GHVT01055932.1.p1 GENE.GHVT01055932.1~~GHVT01055932.1.p1  ORF type:complete len:614 (-),score=130.77 GHVT01055932.1:1130-2971(-)